MSCISLELMDVEVQVVQIKSLQGSGFIANIKFFEWISADQISSMRQLKLRYLTKKYYFIAGKLQVWDRFMVEQILLGIFWSLRWLKCTGGCWVHHASWCQPLQSQLAQYDRLQVEPIKISFKVKSDTWKVKHLLQSHHLNSMGLREIDQDCPPLWPVGISPFYIISAIN